MKFSFIIPVYNTGEYLRQCVGSITRQSFTNLEIILVDDGSSDNSSDICDMLAIEDVRIRVVHKQNGGPSSARNTGLAIAKGDYIIFLDSDDWWCDDSALSRILHKIEETNSDIILIRSRKYYSEKKCFEHLPNHDRLPTDDIMTIEETMRYSLFKACAWDKVVRKTVLSDHDIEFRDGQSAEDIEWCCQLISLNLTYSLLDGIIHVYRKQNPMSLTSNVGNKSLFDMAGTIKRYKEIASSMDNKYLLHFLAYQYVVWMAISNNPSSWKGNLLIGEMESCIDLLEYKLYPLVSFVSKFKFLGYGFLRQILSLYLRILSLFKI